MLSSGLVVLSSRRRDGKGTILEDGIPRGRGRGGPSSSSSLVRVDDESDKSVLPSNGQ